MKCPKCGYVRTEDDGATMPGVCPQCGIAYNKWQSAHKTQNNRASQALYEPQRFTSRPILPWHQRALRRLTEIPGKVEPGMFWGQVGLYSIFFLWGWSFILGGVDWVSIGGSFLHNVNLPFHEFGHVLFRPFGYFMMVLGGSLFQVLMPLGLLLAFILQRRDTFAASVMLWWSGQNFIDVSPYIADAQHRALPLILGASEDFHDWGNLLSMTGTLHKAQYYASLSFGIGVVLLLVSMGWGAYLLICQFRKLKS